MDWVKEKRPRERSMVNLEEIEEAPLVWRPRRLAGGGFWNSKPIISYGYKSIVLRDLPTSQALAPPITSPNDRKVEVLCLVSTPRGVVTVRCIARWLVLVVDGPPDHGMAKPFL
ncbi:hypothetical protein Ancab_001232 [Ancistrocladus abbreviatus]